MLSIILLPAQCYGGQVFQKMNKLSLQKYFPQKNIVYKIVELYFMLTWQHVNNSNWLHLFIKPIYWDVPSCSMMSFHEKTIVNLLFLFSPWNYTSLLFPALSSFIKDFRAFLEKKVLNYMFSEIYVVIGVKQFTFLGKYWLNFFPQLKIYWCKARGILHV